MNAFNLIDLRPHCLMASYDSVDGMILVCVRWVEKSETCTCRIYQTPDQKEECVKMEEGSQCDQIRLPMVRPFYLRS
jgi:hypothetical protein